MQGLKQKRKKLGLTQNDLAKKLGVGQNSVSQWETGAVFPLKPTLDKLCKFFGCKVDDLL